MKFIRTSYILFVWLCTQVIAGQVIFEDDTREPARQPKQNDTIDPNPQPLQVGLQETQSNDFQFPDNNDNENVDEFDEEGLTSRRANCESFQGTPGFCTRMLNCDMLRFILQRRPPNQAIRIYNRSICGFHGFNPLVCCPFQRSGQHHQPQRNNNGVFITFGSNGIDINSGSFNRGNNGRPNHPPPNGQNGFPPPPGEDRQRQGSNNRPPQSNNRQNGFPSPFVDRQRPSGFQFQPQTTPRPIFHPPELVTSAPAIQQPLPRPDPVTGGLVLIPPSSHSHGHEPEITPKGLPEHCGKSNFSAFRIVGGKEANPGDWPWIAALGYRDENANINFLCGGALVSSQHIVTAAHCVHNRNELAMVRLGDHDIFSDADGLKPIDIAIVEKHIHPNYVPSVYQNDIAVLKLRHPVAFTDRIHPICLPTTPPLRFNRFEHMSPFVAGWGAIQFNGPSSSTIRAVQLPIVSDSECQEKFKSFKSAHVDGTNICAGFLQGGKDACQGDSGGPLMQPVGDSKYVLIGVVSFGFRCAEPGFPGVYARVTNYLNWIESHLK